MNSNMILEDYSDKSMVLKGDTRQYKEDIKKLGGKWNSNLTDKKSGDKFGGWIFFKSNTQQIKKWIDDGYKINDQHFTITTQKDKFSELEKRVEKLEKQNIELIKIIEQLKPKEIQLEIEDEEDEEDEEAPRKRLLR